MTNYFEWLYIKDPINTSCKDILHELPWWCADFTYLENY